MVSYGLLNIEHESLTMITSPCELKNPSVPTNLIFFAFNLFISGFIRGIDQLVFRRPSGHRQGHGHFFCTSA